MASSSQSIESLNNYVKRCSHCDKSKIIDNFIWQNKEHLKEFSHYNICTTKKKRKSVNIESEETTYSESINLVNILDNDNIEEIIAYDNNVLYDLVNLESVIVSCFIDIEEVHFLKTFRLEDELVNDILSNDDEENKYLNIVLPFLLLIKIGSYFY
ncbi:6435_t:CDS:1 [Cetraspora pellucida]|uniref:6435_t:CDS:1 n=1 Tax=Cetraspora pellucida TaxID=1433469 RepID=A0A9N9DQL3_9GLOM|nr:6435_t:CDS:1 [Cetraspora pellucida]